MKSEAMFPLGVFILTGLCTVASGLLVVCSFFHLAGVPGNLGFKISLSVALASSAGSVIFAGLAFRDQLETKRVDTKEPIDWPL